MSIFEMLMLICFGAAWPMSIYKSYTSGDNAGKSFWFLFIILIGYISGTIHKLLYSFDIVIYLYVLNGLMVLTDIILYYRNEKLAQDKS
ncbi:hypothetical protein [Selenihalanaerobacter shriftii]|uniref:PQ loop repeat-containing protein n=1 Tax=Selenihalanaerobacter shriftii TaxID=142842 RepID=A0A1T4LKD4_9FIRM|nr:hypothetical protein [Selenihalanaerobacter shriftii]SJZ55175.1 hypothetical protein SAMN02745118_01181 [Selenihalanaerobacter shriftii]